jgi:uncharacterized protein
MDITPLLPKGRKSITGYGGGGFKINQEFVAGSLLVVPDAVMPWNVTDITTATLEDFSALLAHEGIELLLVGTGERMTLLPTEIRAAFKAKNISTDVMDTGAACRTYNVLLSEERKVAAAVIAV